MGTGNWLCHSNFFFSVNEVHNGDCTMWERWTKLIKLFYQIMYKLCEGHGFHWLSMCFLFAFSVLLSVAQCSHEMWTFFVSWICLIICDKNPEHADVLCICPSEQQCLTFKPPLLLCHLQETRRLCHQTTFVHWPTLLKLAKSHTHKTHAHKWSHSGIS